MKQINFNDKIRRIPQKQLGADALSQGLIMVKLQVTDMEYSGVFAYPYKYLPVMTVTSEKPSEMGTTFGKEGIVMPKGTIVSLLTNQTSIASGIPDPASSGTIPWFKDQLDSGNLVVSPIDDRYFGYEDSVTALLVPANGGVASEIPYSSLDDDIGLWSKSSDENLQLSANIPIGIVIKPVYQDIRGANLNYQTHDAEVPIIGGRLDVPYVDTSKVSFGSPADVLTDTDSGYYRLWRKWQFLYFNGSSNEGRSGVLLKSDKYGKFICENASVTASKTAQTVGRILTTDSRYPKELTNMIQHYPGVDTMMGVKTAGIPTDLYLFAKDVLAAAGAAYTAKDISEAVRAGVFGMVRIQISCNR